MTEPFSHSDVAALFGRPSRLQRQLDVESALALAQAAVGIVPVEAADRIAAVAHLELFDDAELLREEARTGHSLVPLVAGLAALSGPEAGGWVHWGATTQNIQQTSESLALRVVVDGVEDLLRRIVGVLADLAEEYAETVMAGRTHGQQAVPITFGLKVSAWVDAFLHDLERLAECAPRVLTCMTGGAAGTFAAMGERGPEVQAAVAARLGLLPMPVPSRNIVDPFAELVCVLGLACATAGSVADEVARLMSVEFGELAEPVPDGDVGSSTMPQKRNPKRSGSVVTSCARVRGLVPTALEAVVQSHEVDGARSALMEQVLEQACTLAVGALGDLHEILSGLCVFPARMRANLDLTGGLICAEAVMMALAESIGRQRAHDLVHHLAHLASTTEAAFDQLLRDDPVVGAALSASELSRLLDPATHVGLSARLARETAARARAVVTGARAPGRGSRI